MEEYQIVCKIHEIRSYIASDWPSIEERKSLYAALEGLERVLRSIGNEAEKDKPQED